jgi:hypothetical protein
MKRNKLLIWAIPLIILMSGYAVYEYGIVSVYRQYDEIREQNNIKMKMLKKCNALIAQKPLLEKQIVELKRARKDEDVKMFTAQTMVIASANLQNAVKGIIAGRGGVINSERMEKADEEGKFKIISVSVDAVFPDIRALSDTLLAIETQTPYLVVREVDVRVRNFADPKDLIVKLKVAALAGQ